jgi:hypothetical protein
MGVVVGGLCGGLGAGARGGAGALRGAAGALRRVALSFGAARAQPATDFWSAELRPSCELEKQHEILGFVRK